MLTTASAGLASVLAVRFHRLGDPSVLQVDEVPEPPAPIGDQLLVRVQASSVNGTDVGLRRGAAKIVTLGRLPFVPGDRVIALLGHTGGGQAEQVLVAQHRAALAPRTVTPAEAAALPLAGLTALQALYGLARLRGRTAPHVLVVGAAGGIGSFGVQLAKLVGARVTGVASGAKLDFVRGLGADEVVDYRQQDVPHLGQRFDVILDAPGQYRFAELRPALTDSGVLVSTRPITLDAVRRLTPVRLRSSGPQFTAVMTKARSADLTCLSALVDRGLLSPSVDRVYPMTEAAAAHQRVEGAVRGKVVIELGLPADAQEQRDRDG